MLLMMDFHTITEFLNVTRATVYTHDIIKNQIYLLDFYLLAVKFIFFSDSFVLWMSELSLAKYVHSVVIQFPYY